MSGTAVDVALDVGFFRRWVSGLAEAVEEGCDELTRLDAAIGDADHGINMVRGMRAAVAALESSERGEVETPAAVLRLTGSRLIGVVGGASGPLYGTAFRSMGEALGSEPCVTITDLVASVRAALAGIQHIGAAEAGDKTMVDAWLPAVSALEEPVNGSVRARLAQAEQAAREGMISTIPMRAHKGRASYLGWRSEGHQDPGATSTHLLFASLVAAWAQDTGQPTD